MLNNNNGANISNLARPCYDQCELGRENLFVVFLWALSSIAIKRWEGLYGVTQSQNITNDDNVT